MSYLAEAWADSQKPRTGGQLHVLRIIASLYRDEEGYAWPSNKYLAAKTLQSEKTVERNLTALEEAGYLRRETKHWGPDGGAKRHIYLNFDAGQVEEGLRHRRARPTRKSPRDNAVRSPQNEGTFDQGPNEARSPQNEGQVPSSCGSGTLTGEGTDSLGTPNRDSSDPDGSAPRGGAAVRDFRKDLFERGVRTLLALTARPEARCRTLIGTWLKLVRDDAVTVLRAIDEAVEAEAIDPVAWIEARLKRPRTAAKPPAGTPIAPEAATARQVEAIRMVQRGEWPVGGTVFVREDSPEGRAWEAYFAAFGQKTRWRQCSAGTGWYMPMRLPEPRSG